MNTIITSNPNLLHDWMFGMSATWFQALDVWQKVIIAIITSIAYLAALYYFKMNEEGSAEMGLFLSVVLFLLTNMLSFGNTIAGVVLNVVTLMVVMSTLQYDNHLNNMVTYIFIAFTAISLLIKVIYGASGPASMIGVSLIILDYVYRKQIDKTL